MAKKWTEKERVDHYHILHDLYIEQNRTLKEISQKLSISEKTLYKRMKTLGIPSMRSKKSSFCNKRTLEIPTERTELLAEFFGIMLGDGKLSPSQILVTLGSKEHAYVEYVYYLLQKLFKTKPRIAIRKTGYNDVYIGSVVLSAWCKKEGLVYNKVQSQVDVPSWILKNKKFSQAFLKGFFDTDGSIYKLRHGIQISLTNKSLPLLIALQKMLFTLEYKASEISSWKVYITKREDVLRFFKEVRPANKKHLDRFSSYTT